MFICPIRSAYSSAGMCKGPEGRIFCIFAPAPPSRCPRSRRLFPANLFPTLRRAAPLPPAAARVWVRERSGSLRGGVRPAAARELQTTKEKIDAFLWRFTGRAGPLILRLLHSFVSRSPRAFRHPSPAIKPGNICTQAPSGPLGVREFRDKLKFETRAYLPPTLSPNYARFFSSLQALSPAARANVILI